MSRSRGFCFCRRAQRGVAYKKPEGACAKRGHLVIFEMVPKSTNGILLREIAAKRWVWQKILENLTPPNFGVGYNFA